LNKKNTTDVINEKRERDELLEWIPTLVRDKLNNLSTEQLRILHYVLGYDSHEADTELIEELFEGYGYTEELSHEIASIMKRDGILVIEKPY